MRPRPPSKRKKNSNDSSSAAGRAQRGSTNSDDDLDDEQAAEYLRQKKKKHKKMDPHQAGLSMRISLDVGEPCALPDAEYEERVAFCCKVCHCSKKVKDQFHDSEFLQASAELVLWHRRCCHRDEEHNEVWASPYLCCLQEAQEQLFAEPCANCKKPHYICKVCRTEALEKRGIDSVNPKAVYMKYMERIREENERMDEADHTIIYNRLCANPTYVAHQKRFRKDQAHAKLGARSKQAVVVDLFGGIGSAIIALKRLNIAIRKIIHVEHDKVANYVYKYWNCLDEKREDDGIEHIFIAEFKTFQDDLDLLLSEHGPFDIVIGGPPHVEYTGKNSPRKGVGKKQDSYLHAMGLTVKAIQRYNQSKNCNLFFLAEGAVLSNDQELDMAPRDLNQALKSFGMDWHIPFDSRDHSPLRRKRTYITNVPVLKPLDILDPPPSLCFDDGYDLADIIFDPERGNPKVSFVMSSLARLDDHPRMSIYKEHGTSQLKFLRRTPNVAERERLMGLPPGYVSRPLENLFTNLISKGFAPEAVEVNKHWKDCLAEEFHEFAGDYHGLQGRCPAFQFYSAETNDSEPIPAVKLKLVPPSTSKQPQHYTEEEYGKRLIGNAFSIPTLEFLLHPLKPFFGKRRYSLVDYAFAWAEWDPSPDPSPKRSDRVKALMHEVADDNNDDCDDFQEHDEKSPSQSTVEKVMSNSTPNSLHSRRIPMTEVATDDGGRFGDDDQHHGEKSPSPKASIISTPTVFANPNEEFQSKQGQQHEVANDVDDDDAFGDDNQHDDENSVSQPTVTRVISKPTVLLKSTVEYRSRQQQMHEVADDDQEDFGNDQRCDDQKSPPQPLVDTGISRSMIEPNANVERHSSPDIEYSFGDPLEYDKKSPSQLTVHRGISITTTAPDSAVERHTRKKEIEKLSLPPASAMEEVDRQLLFGVNDDENEEEDFDV